MEMKENLEQTKSQGNEATYLKSQIIGIWTILSIFILPLLVNFPLITAPIVVVLIVITCKFLKSEKTQRKIKMPEVKIEQEKPIIVEKPKNKFSIKKAILKTISLMVELLKTISLIVEFLKTRLATNVFLFVIICVLIISSVNICKTIRRYSFNYGYELHEILDETKSINYSLDDIERNTRKTYYY